MQDGNSESPRTFFTKFGLAILIAAMGASCGESAPAPDIELPTDHLQMGEIGSDRLGETLIAVFNRGGSPLVIEKVTTSCHCTEGYMVDSVIPAGGQGTMRVTVDPTRVPGDTSTKILTILSNDPDEPALELMVSATIAPGAVIVPAELDFGTIPEGQGAELRARLRQVQESPLEILRAVNVDTENLTTRVEEIPAEEWSDPEKAEFDLVVTFLPGAAAAAYKQEFILFTNTREGIMTLPIKAKIAADSPSVKKEDLP